jgi:hypothetical protein
MTCSQIALALNVLGTVGVGVLPVVGLASGYGAIVWRGTWWRVAWFASWLVFAAGVALTFAC